jgi:hypothetical protein
MSYNVKYVYAVKKAHANISVNMKNTDKKNHRGKEQNRKQRTVNLLTIVIHEMNIRCNVLVSLQLVPRRPSSM